MKWHKNYINVEIQIFHWNDVCSHHKSLSRWKSCCCIDGMQFFKFFLNLSIRGRFYGRAFPFLINKTDACKGCWRDTRFVPRTHLTTNFATCQRKIEWAEFYLHLLISFIASINRLKYKLDFDWWKVYSVFWTLSVIGNCSRNWWIDLRYGLIGHSTIGIIHTKFANCSMLELSNRQVDLCLLADMKQMRGCT